MRNVKVTPLKNVDGVKFGETRVSVRRDFGKSKEFKKTSKSPNPADDFGWCHAFYDSNNRLEAVEIFMDEAKVVVSGKTITSSTSADQAKKELGISGETDTSKSIGLTVSDGKIKAILFGKSGYYKKNDESKEPEKKKEDAVKKESVNGASPLTQFYDDLKSKVAGPAPEPVGMRVGGGMMADMQHPGAIAFRRKAAHECEHLKDKCYKHILLDIYCKISPLDADYVAGNQGQMSADIDNMLASKNLTPTQYMTSCSSATKAPLLEFVCRSVNNIGKAFMEEQNDALKDAQEQDMEAPTPKAPDPEDSEDVANQLVDVKKDSEYETFIDTLKDKTIKKIVSDVSKIISDKKEEKDMTFDPKPTGAASSDEIPALESTVSIGMDFLQKRLMTEGVELSPELTEQMIGMAIRESTLNVIDQCFGQPESAYGNFATRIRLGKGAVINESAATYLIESANSGGDN